MEQMKDQQCVLGIDGGGTKTHAVLLKVDGSLAGEATAERSNVQIVGAKRAAEIILKLAKECCEKTACRLGDIQSIGIGLAGAGREADRTAFVDEFRLLAKKEKIQLPSPLVETDARVALEGAHPTMPGIVLIAGTGSIACSKSNEGKVDRVGGWGRIVGDEGSGYAIGCDAVNAVLRAHDGRGDRTVLLDLVKKHFQVSAIEDVIPQIAKDHGMLSEFAPLVLEAELQRDHVAHTILFRAAGELADLVRSLVMKLQPKRKLPVVMLGGLLEKENVYSRMVKERIIRPLPQVVIQKAKFPPAYGAAILAFRPFEFPS